MAINTETPARGDKRPIPVDHVKAFKTAVYQLHNPSKHQRAVLRDGMKRPHLAYERLLNKSMPTPDEIARLSKLPKGERRAAIKPLTDQIMKDYSRYPQLSSNAKDAIGGECIAQIKSTIGLHDKQDEVGFPTVTRINHSQPDFDTRIDKIVTALDDEDKRIADLAKDELNRVSRMGTIRPLNFVRTRITDGFMLLRHTETGRLWVWLNLHPKESRFAKKVDFTDRNLVNVKTNEMLAGSSTTGALYPLLYSREAERKFHDNGNEGGEPKTARLCYHVDRDVFEVHVAFKFVAPKVKPTTWMGIDRGIYNLAAYAVLDENGVLLDKGFPAIAGKMDGMELRRLQRSKEKAAAEGQGKGKIVRDRKRSAYGDEASHAAGKGIVNIARQHECHVIIEDLTSLNGPRKDFGPRRLLGRAQYEKFRKIISYKLKLGGLPEPTKVSAKDTSTTCPWCGNVNKANRPKVQGLDKVTMDKFCCTGCDYEDDADKNAAHVIALKGMWEEQCSTKELKAKYSFENYIKDSAKRRMFDGACSPKGGYLHGPGTGEVA